MKHQIYRIMFGAAVTLCGIVMFLVVLEHAVWFAPSDDGPVAIAVTTSAPVSMLPVRLRIPAIGVNAAVQYTGITAKGTMGTPSNFTDVAWYKAGTVPGQRGSAVMDGHVDNGLSLAGVFKRLDTMHVGEDVYVTETNGSELHFVVASTALYPYTNAPTDIIFNQADKAYLKLITCDGAWVPGGRTYDHRLVVTAVLVSS